MSQNENSFCSHFQVEWRDVDLLGHMRNTSYVEYATQTRVLFFKQHGHPINEFIAEGIGPVAIREEIYYFKELRFLDKFSVSLWLDGMNKRMTRFRYLSEFVLPNKEVAAAIFMDGIWMDLRARKMIHAAESIVNAILELPKTASFSEEFPRKTYLIDQA